ncbi:MAG: plastocyanin/azurin family copper-binding protein [Halobacteriales archaeon]|nr:plastocyanin/azurin family copper-binding protein [Halobacteriales archaeon]
MRRRDFLQSVGSVTTVSFVGLAGCSSGNEGDTTPTDQPTGTTVNMLTDGGQYYFDPIGLAVDPGTTVTFRNENGSHSATAYQADNGYASTTRIPEGAEGFDSGTLTTEGETYEHTFETEGTYDYFCIPHKTLGMVGRIVVGSPGGPAEGSMPPDGKVPTSDRIVDEKRVLYGDFTD